MSVYLSVCPSILVGGCQSTGSRPGDSLFLSLSFLVAVVLAVPAMISVAMVFLVTMSLISGVTIRILNHGDQEPKRVSPPLDSSSGIFHSNGNLTCTQIPVDLPLC